ncbi:hypothetical protein [Methylocystis iwaonis]|uniref:hypothetical protein n=1 Tax=Methylocystis iwaonis TaxID=2885079 RepID=UPI002E7B5EE5|nr:hypothetical protein [Methylocystis iwaonis]
MTVFDAMPKRLLGALVLIGLEAQACPAQGGSALAATPPSTPFDVRWIIDATTSSFVCPVERK